MHQYYIIWVEPMGKPRQTQSDKWRKREVVVRYRAYADKIRAACREVMESPVYVGIVAYLSMPESWSAKKKAKMAGSLHQSKPDGDNIFKGLTDALIENDQCVAISVIAKLWDDGLGARIELTVGDRDFALTGGTAAAVLPGLLGKKVPGNPAG